jgi:hypothetical protein
MRSTLAALAAAAATLSSNVPAADDGGVLLEAAAGSYHATFVAGLDSLPERRKANRLVIPAAFASADGTPATLAYAGGTRLSMAAWPEGTDHDGGVLIDGDGAIHIEHMDTFEHGDRAHALRHDEEDFEALKEVMGAQSGGFFQTRMWIDGGQSMLGSDPPGDRHRRLSLAETEDGTLMVVTSGTRVVTIAEHVATLLEHGAHDAVAVDPAGFACWRESGDTVEPCGPFASSYLVIDYD